MTWFKRFAIGVLILVAGVAAAIPFRRDGARQDPRSDATPLDVPLRIHASGGVRDTSPLAAIPDGSTNRASEALAATTPAASERVLDVPVVLQEEAELPELAANYFERLRPAGDDALPGEPTDTGGSKRPAGRSNNSPKPAQAMPRVHRVIDGDTLASIAQSYLGNPGRQREIFEANRAVIPHPDLLPIGIELVIPTGSGSETAEERPPAAPLDDLVPVASGGP